MGLLSLLGLYLLLSAWVCYLHDDFEHNTEAKCLRQTFM